MRKDAGSPFNRVHVSGRRGRLDSQAAVTPKMYPRSVNASDHRGRWTSEGQFSSKSRCIV
jgi:hypothetical protein